MACKTRFWIHKLFITSADETNFRFS